MPKRCERRDRTVAVLSQRRIIFYGDICDGHRPPLQQKNDYPGARCRYHGRRADRERRGGGFGKSNYRRWKISGDFRAPLRTHAGRSWRASAAAGINQRALPSRLHLFTRSNLPPEIFCGLDPRDQRGKGETLRARLSGVDYARIRRGKVIWDDDDRKSDRVPRIDCAD